jgi:hypothetical protein
MMKKINYWVTLSLILSAIVVMVILQVLNITYSSDETVNKLLTAIIPRLVCGVVFIVIIFFFDRDILLIKRGLAKKLLWCIPCFVVAVVNFPFSALISGSATIERADLIPLFALYCVAVGIMEEAVFRGLIQRIIQERLNQNRHRTLITVALSSAIFAVIHFMNLLEGADVGSTFLQVGYSFLIGGMLGTVLIKTENLWVCVILHALFDFGGLIVTYLGFGEFQDIIFWILTAIGGILCLIHTLFYIIKRDKKN